MTPAIGVFLIIAYVMPGQVPDIKIQIQMDTLEHCWAEAKEFVDSDMPDTVKKRGAIGLASTCGVIGDLRFKT